MEQNLGGIKIERLYKKAELPVANQLASNVVKKMFEQDHVMTTHIMHSFLNHYLRSFPDEEKMRDRVLEVLVSDEVIDSEEKYIHARALLQFIRTKYELEMQKHLEPSKRDRYRVAEATTARELFVGAAKKVAEESDLDVAMANDLISKIVVGVI